MSRTLKRDRRTPLSVTIPMSKYDRLRKIADARESSISRTVERAIDLVIQEADSQEKSA